MEYRKVQRAEHGKDTANCKRWSQRTVSCSSCCVLLTAALLVIPSSRAYTLDTTSPMVLSPDKSTGDTMFGYVIAFWNKPDLSSWLLVGAPDWKKTNQGGALFQCSLDASSPLCQTLEVDRGEKTCLEKLCEDIAGSQRLGATLAVHEDIALVCAPNWSYKQTNTYGKITGAPVGKCFYSKNNGLTNFTSFSSVYDLKQENLYYFNTGYCQAGFSALLLPEEQKVALGAPGCYAWTGDVMVGEPHSTKYTNKSRTYNPSEDFGIPSSSVNVEPYNRYMGYSIAKGTFNNKPAVVAGAPKASTPSFMKAILDSSVSVMERLDDKKLKIWKQLYPPLEKGWYFSYCGYSIGVGDLNGDGLDDVAVGCPNYADDKGAVLVYYQIKEADGTFKMELEKPDYRMGSERGARFGSSVTVLGDIDGDGYQELAVGSPFTSEAMNSSGRLYIYCSTKGQDLPKTPCQEVAAPGTDASSRSVLNFGWSATAQGTSVAVSAPASEAVLVFRTRPVVQLSVTVGAPDELDVSRHCPVKSGEDAPCVNITVCLQYTMRNGPKDSRLRDMSVGVQLQPMKALYFGTGAKSALVYFNNMVDEVSCKQLLVYDRKKNGEIVEYEITARGNFTPSQDDPVVLDGRQGLDSSAMLRMKVDCVDSTYATCQPDMRVSIDQDGDFVLGVQERVQLTVTITVSGDPAYYPKLVMSSAGFMASSSEIKIEGALGECSENISTHDIACSLGGVLQDTKATVTLSLGGSEKFFNMTNMRTGDNFFMVMASATCSSSIKEPSYGNDTKRVDITVKPDKLHLSRFANPDGLDLRSWSDGPSSSLESRGPKVVHSYEVDNPNNYDLYGVLLTIYWPQKHKDGYLLYTIQAPSFQRGDGFTGYCEALAGGGFDEQHLYNANTTDTVISIAPSTASGEQLGSDIEPLIIQCLLGDMSKQDSIVVEVESYAFYETFDKLKDNPVNPIKSVGVAAPSSAPLGKTFTDNTTEFITTAVIYPEAPFPWWWVLVGIIVGLALLIIMGVLFKKYVLTKKVIDENDAVDGEEMKTLGEEDEDAAEEDEDAAEKEPLDKDLAGETSMI